MMKISVAVAAYCGEKFIGEQIDSLLKQTRIPDEIIITDDSPDDRTCTALASFLSDPRIIYQRNEKQLGVNRNFEKALSLCSGDIIFLCDQDDVWLPDKIETMIEVLEKDPACDGVFCNSSVVDEELKPLGYSLWQMRGFSAGMRRLVAEGQDLDVFLRRVTLSTHNIALRRRALERCMPFPDLGVFYADTWLALRVASSGCWAMAEKELTLYRVHGENLSAPGSGGLKMQMRLARQARRKNLLPSSAHLAEELLDRLPEDAPENIRKKLIGFYKFSRHRNAYSGNFCLRAFQILREMILLRYSRFSNGWKSIAADLFLF